MAIDDAEDLVERAFEGGRVFIVLSRNVITLSLLLA